MNCLKKVKKEEPSRNNISQKINNSTPVELVEGNILGSVVQEQFIIGSYLNNGAFGNVHKCIDKFDTKRPLVIKLQLD